jgi:hypothetical protein
MRISNSRFSTSHRKWSLSISMQSKCVVLRGVNDTPSAEIQRTCVSASSFVPRPAHAFPLLADVRVLFRRYSWCGPCKTISPLLAQAYKGLEDRLKLTRLNVDDNPDKATEYQVSLQRSLSRRHSRSSRNARHGFSRKEAHMY